MPTWLSFSMVESSTNLIKKTENWFRPQRWPRTTCSQKWAAFLLPMRYGKCNQAKLQIMPDSMPSVLSSILHAWSQLTSAFCRMGSISLYAKLSAFKFFLFWWYCVSIYTTFFILTFNLCITFYFISNLNLYATFYFILNLIYFSSLLCCRFLRKSPPLK